MGFFLSHIDKHTTFLLLLLLWACMYSETSTISSLYGLLFFCACICIYEILFYKRKKQFICCISSFRLMKFICLVSCSFCSCSSKFFNFLSSLLYKSFFYIKLSFPNRLYSPIFWGFVKSITIKMGTTTIKNN